MNQPRSLRRARCRALAALGLTAALVCPQVHALDTTPDTRTGMPGSFVAGLQGGGLDARPAPAGLRHDAASRDSFAAGATPTLDLLDHPALPRPPAGQSVPAAAATVAPAPAAAAGLPEPSSLVALLAGLLAAGYLLRRRNS